ncbi:MAG: GIY-YIG nuclease family protein [Planctomycetaceae bacterium]|nr:GIY-YIG nuclease family protein [Planctomycetaceae bacterium]
MNKPYSIKIFLPGGDPDGLRTIEKSNWSGAGMVIPRALMAAAKSRRELTRTGVYVLLGPPEESGLPRVYVGEGDPIKPRLDQHAAKKDFWTVCIAFTSKDENLNKAHVQYIESRLIAFAAQAKRCVLDNGNVPALPSLSEADAADAEGFLSEMLLCFPVLGLSVFTAAAPIQKSAKSLYITAKGIQAEGRETHDGFVVRSGSGAVKGEVPSCHAYLKELRAALIANGVLKPAGEGYAFTQDYVFPSPSTAAGVVQGRAANGRVDWKTKDGKTLKDLQEAAAKE